MKHFRLKHPEEHKIYHAAKNALKAAKKTAGAARTRPKPAAVGTADNRPVAHEEAGQESERVKRRRIPRIDEEEVPVDVEGFDEDELVDRFCGVELVPRTQEPESVWKFNGPEAELVYKEASRIQTEEADDEAFRGKSVARRRKRTPRKCFVPQTIRANPLCEIVGSNTEHSNPRRRKSTPRKRPRADLDAPREMGAEDSPREMGAEDAPREMGAQRQIYF
jgi:hypothetical protein